MASLAARTKQCVHNTPVSEHCLHHFLHSQWPAALTNNSLHCPQSDLWRDLTAYLLPDLDKSLLNLHGIEAIQGVGHPHTAGITAMLPGNGAKSADSEVSETEIEIPHKLSFV